MDQALLLDSVESARSGSAFSARDAQGVGLQLSLGVDGSVAIRQADGQARGCCPGLERLCRAGSRLPAQIPASDIVGATTSGSQLVIWHAPLATKAGAEKPVRRVRRSPPLLLDGGPAAAEQAAAHLRRTCCWRGRPAPPRLLVVVNPASGPGKAPSIYERQVRPTLEAAGCKLTMHETRSQGHATELVRGCAPGTYDALVAIGGDGTMHEVLQGMLARPDWERMAATPFAQVPCGSGNALAASCGMWSVDTAVHAVVKGQQRALDIASVLQHAPAARRFCFLSLNYGLICNLDIGTEALRWMGGTRFVVGALREVLLLRTHAARIALLEPQPTDGGGDGGSSAFSGSSGGGGGGASGGAGAGAAAGASAAAGSGGGSGGMSAEEQRQMAAGLAQAAALPGPPVQHLAAFQQVAGQQLPPGWQWLPDADLALFTVTNLPRLDFNFHLAPDALLDSGHFNLIYAPPHGRLKGLELLTASERGEHMHLVKQRHVAALALEPRSAGTWLVVDGEVVPFAPLCLEVHPQLCSTIVAPPPPPPQRAGSSSRPGSPLAGQRSRKMS